MVNANFPVDDAAKQQFADMKQKRKFHMMSFAIDQKESRIVLDKSIPGDQNFDYEVLKAELVSLKNTPRLIIINWTYDVAAKRDKLVFIFWCPDTSSGKEKMVYASARDGFKKSLDGTLKEMQANDISDVEVNALQSLCGGEPIKK